jgi:hypothetical protein
MCAFSVVSGANAKTDASKFEAQVSFLTQCGLPLTLTAPPYGIGSAAPGASAGRLLESGTRFFAMLRVRRPAPPSHGDGAPHMLEREQKKRATVLVSARFHRKDKDLAGINTIWILDLVPVCLVNDGVSHTRAVGDAADVPEAVATGYNRGRDP